MKGKLGIGGGSACMMGDQSLRGKRGGYKPVESSDTKTKNEPEYALCWQRSIRTGGRTLAEQNHEELRSE